MNHFVSAQTLQATLPAPSISGCVQPVILAGGAGTRLWPLSRELYPKQLIGLIDDESLLEATLRRLDGAFASDETAADGIARPPKAAPIVVCSEELRHLTLDQVRQGGRSGRIVLEPVARNTAPALTVAALVAHADAGGDQDPILVVMPADHRIVDSAAFARAIEHAVRHAQRDVIVALGVPPTRAETGYGYIRTGAPLGTDDGARAIERFVEKPDAARAAEYAACGEYWWNCGIFVVRARMWLDAIARYQPAIAAACTRAYARASDDRDGTLRLDRDALAQCPADSIDYAVMERIGSDDGLSGVVVPLDAGWSDVGAWDAVWDASKKDAAGNVVRGRVLCEGTTDSFAHADSRLVACVGVTGVVIVETADAVLVAAKDRVQDVKAIVGRLKEGCGTEAKEHRKVQRPWGCYDSIDRGDRFQVKHIIVKPGGRLSLQMHHHRAEHWVVVRGTALVTRGDEQFLLSENQSAYIPLGMKHRLENPGKAPLEIIEVQSGCYLGEDDIVRFDDQYGRVARAEVGVDSKSEI